SLTCFLVVFFAFFQIVIINFFFTRFLVMTMVFLSCCGICWRLFGLAFTRLFSNFIFLFFAQGRCFLFRFLTSFGCFYPNVFNVINKSFCRLAWLSLLGRR